VVNRQNVVDLDDAGWRELPVVGRPATRGFVSDRKLG